MKAAQHGSILYYNSRELRLGLHVAATDTIWQTVAVAPPPPAPAAAPAASIQWRFQKISSCIFFFCCGAGDEFIELHYVTFGPQSIILIYVYIRIPERTMRRIRDASVAKHSHAFN